MLILKILICILCEWELCSIPNVFLLAAKDSYYDGPANKEGRAAIVKRGYIWWWWHVFVTLTTEQWSKWSLIKKTWCIRLMSCFISARSGLGYTDLDYTLRTFFQLEDSLFFWVLNQWIILFLFLGTLDFFFLIWIFGLLSTLKQKRTEDDRLISTIIIFLFFLLSYGLMDWYVAANCIYELSCLGLFCLNL